MREQVKPLSCRTFMDGENNRSAPQVEHLFKRVGSGSWDLGVLKISVGWVEARETQHTQESTVWMLGFASLYPTYRSANC